LIDYFGFEPGTAITGNVATGIFIPANTRTPVWRNSEEPDDYVKSIFQGYVPNGEYEFDQILHIRKDLGKRNLNSSKFVCLIPFMIFSRDPHSYGIHQAFGLWSFTVQYVQIR